MRLSKYVACICEGAAESAIIDLLLDNGRLIFSRGSMLDEQVIRCRGAKTFEERYLRKNFSEKISVVRILDSRRENFAISRAYEHQIDVINVVTAPEIEMLVIVNEGKYKEFKKSGQKPSEFCKSCLKLPRIKSYSMMTKYFSDIAVLSSAIKEYDRISKRRENEYTLLDIMK